MRVLIIEDNEIETENLKILLEGFEGFELIGTADTIDKGVDYANRQQPEIVILDIQLDCENSLDHVKALTYQPYLVCSTLHTEHALQAFEIGVTDYLTKPITQEKLSRALNRIPAHPQGTPSRQGKGAIFLKNGTRTEKIHLHSILLVTADRDYSLVRHVNGTEFLSTRRMHEWRELLPSQLFLGLDRSTIVNKEEIRSFTRLRTDRTATITFTSGTIYQIGSVALRRLKAAISS